MEEMDSSGGGSVFIVVMGVSGTGKSTLGSALANALGMPYVDGDDLHPRSNVAKMAAGIPLTDADREPWLAIIRKTAEKTVIESNGVASQPESVLGASRRWKWRNGVVITCSALKKYYRDILRGMVRPELSVEQNPPNENPGLPSISTYFVWIDGPKEVLQDRMEKRQGHFMKASLLESQLRTLERPDGEDGVIVVPLESTTEEQVKIAVERLEQLQL